MFKKVFFNFTQSVNINRFLNLKVISKFANSSESRKEGRHTQRMCAVTLSVSLCHEFWTEMLFVCQGTSSTSWLHSTGVFADGKLWFSGICVWCCRFASAAVSLSPRVFQVLNHDGLKGISAFLWTFTFTKNNFWPLSRLRTQNL